MLIKKGNKIHYRLNDGPFITSVIEDIKMSKEGYCTDVKCANGDSVPVSPINWMNDGAIFIIEPDNVPDSIAEIINAQRPEIRKNLRPAITNEQIEYTIADITTGHRLDAEVKKSTTSALHLNKNGRFIIQGAIMTLVEMKILIGEESLHFPEQLTSLVEFGE